MRINTGMYARVPPGGGGELVFFADEHGAGIEVGGVTRAYIGNAILRGAVDAGFTEDQVVECLRALARMVADGH